MEEKKKPPVIKEEFTLSNEENNAYQLFLKDLNEVHLKDLSPISIAKLYVKAEIDQQYDAVYALYTDRKEHIQWTKEEDRAIPEEDRGTKETLIKKFKNIGTGTFIQTSDDQGYISFQGPEGELGFQMIKDDDGIWNVAFQPIQ
ncbi:RNA polymerase subunit sigma [Bacillus oleronius]|nr:RNA polymerase subunit sigma [Heyndrickxia oleronia]